MDKAPAFQFYANDFVSGTSRMSTTEVGGYILLLCEQWAQGSIPGDEPKRLAAIMRCSTAAARAIWDAVRTKFVRHEDGLWRNVRLEEVRLTQLEFSRRQALKGAKGGRPKKPGGKPEESQTDTQRKPGGKPEESSPISNKDPDTSKNDVSGPKPSDLFEVHQRLFLEKYGQKPEFDGAKDGAIAKRMLRKLGWQRALERVEAFFASRDPWVANSGHGFGLLGSATVQNKLIAEMAQRQHATDRRGDAHLAMMEDAKRGRYDR